MSNLIASNDGKIQSFSKEELDIQISTAKAYPRDVKKFIEDATFLATLDEETAASCIYAKPRGKPKDGEKQDYIKGESVRLAEIAFSCWGNIHAATRIIKNDSRTITAEGVAWDLEKNVKRSLTVDRGITYSNGSTYNLDMQTITSNAASSIVFRNVILATIPRSLIKVIYEAAKKVAIGDQTKLITKVTSYIESFKKLNIHPDRIYAYFGKKDASEITVEEAVEMIGIATAIKEGSLSIDKAFIFEDEAPQTTSVLTAKLAAASTKTSESKQALPPPDANSIKFQIESAENFDDLKGLMTEISGLKNADEKKLCSDLYNTKMREIKDGVAK